MKEELMKWAEELKYTLQTSKNVIDMTTALPILMASVEHLINSAPQKAVDLMENWEARYCNNYINEKEALEGVSKLMNTTGEPAPKWSPNVLFNALETLKVPAEKENLFNEWAMFYTMNWLYSDYAEELSEAVSDDPTKLATLVYKMSVSKLTDPDNPRWIRGHLNLM